MTREPSQSSHLLQSTSATEDETAAPQASGATSSTQLAASDSVKAENVA